VLFTDFGLRAGCERAMTPNFPTDWSCRVKGPPLVDLRLIQLANAC
jgi:hypothetical protein